MRQKTILLNLKGIVINSGIGYGANFAILGLGIITKMLLTRLLSPSEFGLLTTAQIIIGLAVFFAGLSLSEAVVRFVGLYAGHDMSKVKGVILTVFRLNLFGSIAISLLVVLTSGLIAQYICHEPALVGILFLWIISIPFKVLTDMFSAVYQGMGQLWIKIAYVDLMQAISVVMLLSLSFFLGIHSLPVITGVYVASTIISMIILVWLFKHNQLWNIKPAVVASRELLHYSLPLLGAGIVAWPLTMLPLAIGGLTNPECVAYYSLSISLSSFIYMGVSVVEASSTPVWSTYFRSGMMDTLQDNYRFVTRWGFVIGSLIFIPLFFCPEDVLTLVYGRFYRDASQLLWPIAALFLANLVTGPNESILKACGHTRWIFLTRLAVGIVVLVFVYPLIKILGIRGAVIVFIASNGVGIIMYAGCLYKRHGIHPFNGAFVKTLFASATALTATGFIQHFFLRENRSVCRILMALLMYTVFLFLQLIILRAFTPRDLNVFENIYRRVHVGLRIL